jgi:hyperosmotically inducible periplasmic protein
MLKTRRLVNYLLIASSIFIFSNPGWSDTTTTGQNSPSMTQSTEQYVSDSDITARIKSDFLLDKDISSLSISVTTTKGVVTLSGNVRNAAQRHKVIADAHKVVGVKSVKDKLVIKAAN